MQKSKKQLFLLAGWLLFAAVVYKTGWQTFRFSIQKIGVSYIWVMLWPLAYYIPYTLGWMAILPESGLPDSADSKHNPLSFWRLFKARLLGEAVNYMTPLGSLGGDPVRALYLKDSIEGHLGAASVIIDRTLYFLASGIFTIVGILLALFFLDLPSLIRGVSIAVLVFYLLTHVGLVVLQWRQWTSKLAQKLIEKNLFPRKWQSKITQIEMMDAELSRFYRARPGAFAKGLFYNLLGRLAGTLEVWLILYFLGAFADSSAWHIVPMGAMPLTHQLFISLLIAVFVIVLNMVFFMFPSQIGVAEGGVALLFKLMGFDPALGVALQIAKRIKSLFYVGLGLAIVSNRRPEVPLAEGPAN